MKKLLAMILALACVVSLAACGESKPKETEDNKNADTQVEQKKDQEDGKKDAESVLVPLNPTPSTVQVGDVTLTAEYLPLDEPFTAQNGSSPWMAKYGDTIYLGDGDKTVREYKLSGTTLTRGATLSITNRSGLAVDAQGKIYADGGVGAAKIYNADGTQAGEAAATGNIYTSQTADFALTYFSGRDEVTKIAGGAAEPWVISGLKGISAEQKSPFNGILNCIEISGENVIVVGKTEDGSRMVVFDTAGKELVRSEALKYAGITAASEAKWGYFLMASAIIELVGKDGKIIGTAANTNSFFGLENAIWAKDAVMLSDGSVLLCGGVKGKDDTVAQIALYRISGS